MYIVMSHILVLKVVCLGSFFMNVNAKIRKEVTTSVSTLKQSYICHYTVHRLISERLVLCVLCSFYMFVTLIELITVLASLSSHIYSIAFRTMSVVTYKTSDEVDMQQIPVTISHR